MQTPTSLTLDIEESKWERIFVGTILQYGNGFVQVTSINRPNVCVQVLRGHHAA